MIKIIFLIFLFCLGISTVSNVNTAFAQYESDLHTFSKGGDQDDLNVEGDIFSDYNEDLEASQVMEDERFYRYGRFYSFNVAAGFTTFTGNRGNAYENQNPSFGLSYTYFMDFQSAFGLGFEYSKHYMAINVPTVTFKDNGPGRIQINMLRSFFFYRYYVDTSDLGTAITYSNPYIVARLEYWNHTNKFMDRPERGSDTRGAIGGAMGFGLEFPIKMKESYFGMELLYHKVQFGDVYDDYYVPIKASDSGQGYDSLKGDVISLMMSYVFSW
jgi:hypothetical protein